MNKRTELTIGFATLAGFGLVLALAGDPAPLPPPAGGGDPLAAMAAGGRLAGHEQMRDYVLACRQAPAGEATRLRAIATTHADPLVAGNALAALGRMDQVAGDRELAALADDPRPRVRQELLAALGQSRDPAARAPLQRALGSADASERRLAVLGLAAHGEREPILHLLRSSSDPAERAFAQAALHAQPAPQLLAGSGFIEPVR